MTGQRRKLIVTSISRGVLAEPWRTQEGLPKLRPGVIASLRSLAKHGYDIVTLDAEPELADKRARLRWDALLQLLRDQEAGIAHSFLSTDASGSNGDSRTLKLTPLRELLEEADLDRRSSLAVGTGPDLEVADGLGIDARDIEAASHWGAIAHELINRPRTATRRRQTAETQIEVRVDLDSSAPIAISTGIGFFDHMLEQLAKHGGFSLELSCSGDLHVDAHHTVEDVALTLGEALRQALGDKRGIGRYGFVVPMDEAQARVAIDLGGRPYLTFEGQFAADQVGGLPTEMVPHFFRSLADTLGAAFQIAVEGENSHHQVEAIFKSVARALKQAIARDGSDLPSTKGVL